MLNVQNTRGLVSTVSVHITINPSAPSGDVNGLALSDYLPLILLNARLVVVILGSACAIRKVRNRKA
jgi:hypothetical protein